MQSQVREIDPVTVEVQVEVPWDRVHQGLEAGLGKLQKTAKVRGFRPGKVPRSVVKQLFGPQVRGEVITNLVDQALIEAVRTHEIKIVAAPRLESLEDFSEGAPLSFKARIEVRPTVSEISLSNLTVERPSDVVEEAKVDAELEAIRDRHATIVTPDPTRPARLGDILTIDYDVEVGGVRRNDLSATARTVVLGEGSLGSDLAEGLVGKAPGETADVAVPLGARSGDGEGDKETGIFHVTVKDLRERQLPALDDDLAAEDGDFETLAELRASVRERLEARAKTAADAAVREQLIDKVVDLNPIPVPPSLVAEQAASMADELSRMFRLSGVEAQRIREALRGDVEARAEKKVRAAILLGALAEQQGMAVTSEETDARLASVAEKTGKHLAKIRAEYSGDRLAALRDKILEDKLLDYLLSRATVTDAPAVAPDETEEG
jgi:trigger factor